MSTNWRDMFQPYVPGAPLPQCARPITPILRSLYEASAGHCGICGHYGKASDMNVEHVVPRSAGGGNAGNRVPAHYGCNFKKGNRMPRGCERIWLEVINARLAA